MEIRDIGTGGAGVGELPDGRVVFVHRTAPGDRVLVRVTQSKKRWARATLVRVLEPAPRRRTPPCPLYDRCGGCRLQHLEYDAQLEAKRGIVSDALERLGGVDPADARPAEPTEPSPAELRYRSRVSFHLRRLPSRVVAGFHELERPGRILDVAGQCLLPTPRLVTTWERLRDAWGPQARHLPRGRELRLTLRALDRGIVLLVQGGQPDMEGEGARRIVKAVASLRSVWHRPGPADPPRRLAGDEEITERWLGETFHPGPATFLQVNRAAGEALQRWLLERLGEVGGLRIVDAYCGVGALGRRLAARRAEVVGVESDPSAVRAAREGAPDRFRVVEGTVEDVLADLLPADLVLLNPPRAGLDEEVARQLAARPPRRVVYVSCDPATLARDLDRLRPALALTGARTFDLFPQTAHVETVALLCDTS